MRLTRLENARLLGRAIVGNAFETKPGTYVDYIQQIYHEAPVLYNPSPLEVTAGILEHVFQTDIVDKKKLITIPWQTLRRENSNIVPARLAASIIAFSDVQGRKKIPEFFPVDQMTQFLSHAEQAAAEKQLPITIPEQFGIAMRLTDNNPMAAAVLAHSAYRAIARGKDTSISPELSFPMAKILSVSRATADIHTEYSPSRDVLGDTYHWWASFAAGLGFTLSREEYPMQSRMYTSAFYHEAALTTFVRKHVLRRTSFSNHHKDVDRQGLQAGITVGNFLMTAWQ